jgi:hypothetical protein
LVVVEGLSIINPPFPQKQTVDLVVVEVEISLLLKVLVKIIQDQLNKVIQVVLVVVLMTVVEVVALVPLVGTHQHLVQVLVV